MLILTLALVLLAGQLPADAPTPPIPALKAGLGPCSADFSVTDAGGAPVFGATVHVRVRYGAFSVKRADLEVDTDSRGLARIEGLPAKAKPLVYDVQKDGKKATAGQNVSEACQSKHSITLK